MHRLDIGVTRERGIQFVSLFQNGVAEKDYA